ncbi:TMV resistance protein N-like, partial [Syzygium oleosum]|uniref:TMV resistance protein N-like n=1 Tax=Syzygium oleosum TaxID=219896 RepID=UPI0024BB75D2
MENSHNRGGGSTETRETSFDVCLSFRGSDTRRGSVDHLYRSLHQAGIRVFTDEESLTPGESFEQSLTAIRHFTIAIPILSENYASSTRCLRELAVIVDCHRTMGLLIMPVFLDVTPSVVRDRSHVYAGAFAAHRWRRENTNTLREWEEALIRVGSIPGLESDGPRTHASIIEVLVANVLRVLNRYFVGIEHHVERVMKLLNMESSEVRGVGIHGIGGTGKTTIGKLIYKRIFRLFDGCSFLESVTENAKKPGGLVNLRRQLISDLLGKMHGQIDSVDDGIRSIRSRFFHKKVLIVLDDIEPSFGLTSILGNLDWLGSGSRIVITTRDERASNEFKVFL